MNWADYGACFYCTLLPFLLAINYFGRWWSQKLVEVTTFKYSLFFPRKTNCVVFYPKNCIFTFVVEKKVWKLEMLSILIEFPSFCGELSIPQLHVITNCCLHPQRQSPDQGWAAAPWVEEGTRQGFGMHTWPGILGRWAIRMAGTLLIRKVLWYEH